MIQDADVQPNHRHLSAQTLASYASGALAPGAALVAEVHIALCEECAGQFPAATMPQMPWLAQPSWPNAAPPPDRLNWRWAGKGMRIAHLQGRGGIGERLYLLKAEPGAALPRHKHQSVERVVVLQGAFLDGEERFERGDVSERDDADWHRPRATAEGCTCLVATDGPLGMCGIARWVQGFFGV